MHSLEQWRELRWHFLGAGLTVTGSGLDHLNLSTQSGIVSQNTQSFCSKILHAIYDTDVSPCLPAE